MHNVYRALTAACLATVLLMGCPGGGTDSGTDTPPPPPPGEEKVTVAWSIYVGGLPGDYAGSSGILKKWADKYNIEIELVRMDYIPSFEAYVAEQADACVMTNMEALTAASSVDSTVLIVGDYSNGNDAILTRGDLGVADLAGKTVSLVELSVSHYLLARALEMNGLSEDDVNLQNTSDADIGPVFLADDSQPAVVTWNPIVMEVEQAPGITKPFTSAEIPGEILDSMVVRTEVLKAHPELGKALVGAWYEVMATMSGAGPEAEAAIASMADASGTDAAGYNAQLETTAMFYQPAAAVEYATGDKIKESMSFVRKFCFEHGLLGEGVTSEDAVSVIYPDGAVQGAAENVKLRFDANYMQMAAEGTL